MPVTASDVVVVVVDVSAARPIVLPMMLSPVFSSVAIPVVVLVARAITTTLDEVASTVRRHHMDLHIPAEVAAISITVAPEGLGRGYEQ